MKDIFIDADIANTFANTTEECKVDLINWLLNDDNAFLVVTNALRGEYLGGNENCDKEFSISHIYLVLMGMERINPISNQQIKDFQKKHFIWNEITCKRKGSHDPDHIAAILLSERKFAIVKDGKFHNDLLNFHPKKKIKGRAITVVNCPSKIDFKENEAA